MKKKLLLFLLFHLLFGFTLSSKNLKHLVKLHDVNFDVSSKLISADTIKKNKKSLRISKAKAVLPPPSTTAGSSCGDGVSLMQVNVYAFGANGTETIEWFTSQTSVTPIYTGTIYSPSISSTRTYYVRSRSGSDISTRVPVVASIYVAPSAVTLTASPPNNTTSPLCLGTPVTFTASGGADLFEFSVDGVVMQGMSTSRVFTTNALTDGQVVKVRTRYAVTMDGSITETSWGTGALEDNFLSAPLSANASTGYLNSLKISALEDKVVLGIAGKVLNNRSILLFLDTKNGGFNVSNYGDEAGSDPLVRAFNIFNNNPSTFDSYFQADYCLVISTDAAETNYYANVIELRTGASVKTYLGSAATGFPSAVMGVNKNNSGINDYNLGFEVEFLKSLIGYTTGDIKFFALTMNDKEDGSQSVTNSFLSPERTSNLDYGIASIDYNLKDPNPVVVASAALTPCYSEANITMNFVSIPTTASITQPTCAMQTGTIVIATQPGVEYSINGTVYQDSNTFSGLVPGNYTLYVRNKLDNSCVLSSATPAVVNAIPTPPVVPTAANLIQPTCAMPSGSLVITTQTGVEYSLDGTTYQSSNTFTGLVPGGYTLYVRNIADNTCAASSGSVSTINAVPNPPVVPTTMSVTQPTCATPSGSIVITAQAGVEYSLDGITYQASNTFNGLAPGSYTLYVRNTADTTCVTSSASATTIDAVPTPPVVPTTVSVTQPTCGTPSGSIVITTQAGVMYSLDGTTYQASNTFNGLASGNYTLYVRNTADNTCVTPSGSAITINTVPIPPVVPTTASVVQPTCGTPTGSITITTQSGVEYSLDGATYQASNVFSGLAPSTTYTLYVRNTADNTCITSSGSVTTINAIPNPPAVPTSASVTQPTCGTSSGSITITAQSGVAYSLDGITYQASNAFSGLAPGNYTLYVRNTADTTCVTSSSSATTINAIPIPPVVPTTASVTQPTCGTPSGSITITTQTGVEYSLNGTTYQASNAFSGLAPGAYILYVRNIADNTCITPSGSPITINAIPTPPVVPTTVSVVQPTCGIPSGSITITTQTGVEYSLNGTTYQASNTFTGLVPGTYTLYVRNTADNTCVTSSGSVTTINAIPTPPVVPTTASVTQPTCGMPLGSITITAQTGVEYSLNGTTYQASNLFTGLTPGTTYTLYVRNLSDTTCVTSSASTTTINPIQVVLVPTAVSVVQPTCAVQSGTIVVTTQPGVAYSLNGLTYQASNTFAGLAPGNYTLYVRNTADISCLNTSTSAVTINAIPTPPVVPTTSSVVQPTCSVTSGTIVIATQSGVEYSLNGTTYQASNTFTGLAPNNYILYVRNIADNTCSVQSLTSVTINPLPLLPSTPTLVQVVQPTCLVPSGSITISTQANVQYSLGNGYQNSNVFNNLAPGKYTMSVRFTNSIACITIGAEITINAIPPQIQFETIGDCENKEYVITANPLLGSYDPNNVSYQWKDNTGAPIGTNSNVLNVTDVIASTPSGQVVFPVTYTLTVTSTNTGCETSNNVVIESVYCNIQKGISPDGNGSNDFFDLRLMDVKKLEIFNRYGIKVYNQANYTDQWKGQSNKGEDLPSATYYYVIEFNSGEPKTGWIYLIREKQ
ncbi:gliding motility-associated C-terminal domain-containing protein [Flavobacterium algoritolerans]|uniref:Gliding motility-associated C-terminal domain-containing protein n=1 Tax=Flavobacterium algoritolerans TaxID=3041254 RepID=A0ABT6VDS2_9FLAO|nr:gliding motility-associated C-terminal domain-containing protein [Flavobacterium algoritolerans]MDI5896386.1 gliding motility-associated C-terminal domain-containing protein [Flavobacterium algoritolerans]